MRNDKKKELIEQLANMNIFSTTKYSD